MNKSCQISTKESIGEILLKYEQNGMTPKRIKDRWEQYNTRHVPTDSADFDEKIRLYIEKVKSPLPLINNSRLTLKKVDYEEARRIAWNIMVEKIGGKPSDFSKEGNITEVIPHLIRYFIGDPQSVYPLHKGIYLWGDTGSGKTFLMETMQRLLQELGLQHRFFQIQNTPQLTEQILSTGVFEPDKYLKQTIVFDDFGQEEPRLRLFSNEIKPMHSIINRAYDDYKKNGQLLHFTSMLPTRYLHEATDSSIPHIDRRTYERICEMTTPVKLTGKSKRIF